MTHPCLSTPNAEVVDYDDPWHKKRRAVKRLVLEEAGALTLEHLPRDRTLREYAAGLGMGPEALGTIIEEVAWQLNCQARRGPRINLGGPR